MVTEEEEEEEERGRGGGGGVEGEEGEGEGGGGDGDGDGDTASFTGMEGLRMGPSELAELRMESGIVEKEDLGMMEEGTVGLNRRDEEEDMVESSRV